MSFRSRWLRAVGLATLAAAVAAPEVSGQAGLPLQAEAEQIVSKVGGQWGVLAWSIDQDRPLLSINADELFIPASNNKIFSSVWALDLLGPEHRFATDLLVTGPIVNGALRGDVVIRGSGDPAFGYPDYTNDPMDPLRMMARQLLRRGIRVIEGGVIGDPFAFDTILIGVGWPRDTGGGSASYAPRVTGLPFQRNLISIRAMANPAGGNALIELSPPIDVVPVVSSARTGGGRAYAVRAANSDTIRVRGAVRGRGNVYRVGVSNPALMTTAALRMALMEAGIQVRGAARIDRTPEEAKVVHRHFSIPLSAMIREMNNGSDNFFAEHVFKAAAHKAIGKGSYAQGGPASAIHFLRAAGVPLGELYQMDGSGLSLFNRATPNAMVRALVYAHKAPFGRAFHESLAVAGERSGTLRRLFTASAAVNNLHAKTGYINDVRTLSGYVTARNGEFIAFCFFYNGRGTSPARGVQTDLGNLLAAYGGSGAAAAE